MALDHDRPPSAACPRAIRGNQRQSQAIRGNQELGLRWLSITIDHLRLPAPPPCALGRPPSNCPPLSQVRCISPACELKAMPNEQFAECLKESSQLAASVSSRDLP